MKYEKDERGQSAGGYARAAAIDAQETSKKYFDLYSAQEHATAAKVALLAAAAFNGSVYTNPRKTGLKVSCHGRKNHAALSELEKYCVSRGIKGTKTASGTHIYHIK